MLGLNVIQQRTCRSSIGLAAGWIGLTWIVAFCPGRDWYIGLVFFPGIVSGNRRHRPMLASKPVQRSIQVRSRRRRMRFEHRDHQGLIRSTGGEPLGHPGGFGRMARRSRSSRGVDVVGRERVAGQGDVEEEVLFKRSGTSRGSVTGAFSRTQWPRIRPPSRPMTNFVNGDVSPTGCSAESQGMQPRRAYFPDHFGRSPRIGTLR